MTPEWVTAYSAIAQAGTAILLAGITAYYAWLTRDILKHQTLPCVVVYVGTDHNHDKVIFIIAKNIGQGMADNISFECSEPIKANNSALIGTINPPWEEIRGGFLANGIQSLAPTETRKIPICMEMNADSREFKPVKVTTRFSCFGKPCKPTVCTLEIDSQGIYFLKTNRQKDNLERRITPNFSPPSY